MLQNQFVDGVALDGVEDGCGDDSTETQAVGLSESLHSDYQQGNVGLLAVPVAWLRLAAVGPQCGRVQVIWLKVRN